ncbi:MAG: DUF4239 domain-containing protein, partial [Planctomycetia bacterium]|nr:DUF4239 domain-containing protein [Planctomycetia bacterium]
MEFHGFTQGLLIIAGSIAAALLLVECVRRLFSKEMLQEAHDVTGNLLAVVGTLYAVLLGLIVVDALVRFEHAIDVVQEESNSLADIFLLAQRLPDTFRDRLQTTCRDYAREVVDDEWPLMATGHVSMAARKTAFQLTGCLADFEPATESEKVVYPLLLEQIRELWDCRRERVCTAEYGIPAVEWVVLVSGAVVTMLFAGLFRTESVNLQRLVTGLAALLIGLNLYLVSLFGYPFSGELTVSSRPFE